MNNKLFETEDAKAEVVEKLVMNNSTLETNVTNTELLLLAKKVMLEEKEFELNKSSQDCLEKGSSLKITKVRINALKDDLSNIESIKIEIVHKRVEVNEENLPYFFLVLSFFIITVISV